MSLQGYENFFDPPIDLRIEPYFDRELLNMAMDQSEYAEDADIEQINSSVSLAVLTPALWPPKKGLWAHA